MRWFALLGLGTLTLLAQPPVPAHAAPAPANVGKAIGDFTLKSADNQSVSLSALKDKKAVVVFFLGTECPINNNYMLRLTELHAEYAGKNVQFLAINANRQDTVEKIVAHAKKNKLPFPVLKDENNVVADRFEAERVPEAFVLDPAGAIRYRGRIDDQYGVGGTKRPKPTRHDLKEALDEVVAGKAVSVPTTAVAGCLISRVVRTKETGAITYAKEVSRIIQKNCQECHRPGQIGPFALQTYDDAVAWSAMIREVVTDGRMPPWTADRRYGKFANERGLTKEEKDTLLTWIDQGCAKGDDKDLPAPRRYVDGWMIGKPDAVFTMNEEFDVPAQMPARGVRYQYFTVPTNFKEDVWIQAAEAVPGQRQVVHHIIVYVIEPGKGREQRHQDGIGNGFLTAYAPGDTPFIAPAGSAKKLPKGAWLVFQMHYTPNGVACKDRSSIGLVLAKEPPTNQARTRAIANPRFSIPPGDGNHKVTSSSTFNQEVLLLTLFPHMHLRGKDFEYQVVYPDGKRETLLSVRWDFNWQTMYNLKKPLVLPAGTRIECTAHFDNSTKNPNNPDPSKTVRWGDQTWEEMMIGFLDYAVKEPVKSQE